MRYVLQVIAMLTDLMLLGAVIATFYYGNNILFELAIVVLAIWAWCKVGGPFFAWRPRNIKAFMANTKKYGL